jgi:rSAM/selenodomain-associated transferase 1
MLLDIVATWDSAEVLTPGGRRVLAYAPAEARPWFEAQVPASFTLELQAAGDLGQRIHAFFAGEFERGATKIVLTGSDAPTLNPATVMSAFSHLESRDVVLGPATDGGYYLIGCRRAAPSIFEGIDWSTPDVLRQTVERLHSLGLSLAILPPWYDVDTPDDLRMLSGHLRALRLAGHDPRVPRTEALIETLVPGL